MKKLKLKLVSVFAFLCLHHYLHMLDIVYCGLLGLIRTLKHLLSIARYVLELDDLL